MISTQVQGPINGTAASASDDLATPPTGHPRLISLPGAALELTLIGGLALAVFIALGVVGNPWYHVVSIKGGSMAPTIARGDLIVVASAPAKIEPGMVLVLSVGDQVVTHRVVGVNADGTFVTRGDANPVDDDWGGQPVHVAGLYVATIPWLGAVLAVPDVSAASFVDRVSAAMTIKVGPWPTPHLAATIRVVPQTIDLTKTGDVTAYVDGLPEPYALTQIDLASVELCYQGVCAPSDGPAKLGAQAHVTATFTRSELAGIIGTDRGDLALIVQGKLTDGSTFSGQHTNRVTGGTGTGAVAAPGGTAPAPVVAPVASPSPDATATPSPSATQSAGPASIASPSPSPTDPPSPSPTDAPSPSGTPSPSPSPDASPVATPTPSSSPAPSPTATPMPSPAATPSPTAS